MTQAAFTQQAVDTHLDKIVAGLAALRITTQKNVGPSRLPVSDGLLKALRDASAQAGIPASALMAACLSLASQQTKATKGRKAGK